MRREDKPFACAIQTLKQDIQYYESLAETDSELSEVRLGEYRDAIAVLENDARARREAMRLYKLLPKIYEGAPEGLVARGIYLVIRESQTPVHPWEVSLQLGTP